MLLGQNAADQPDDSPFVREHGYHVGAALDLLVQAFDSVVAIQAIDGLLVVLVYSRHSLLWPLTQQTVEATIDGLEQAWRFF